MLCRHVTALLLVSVFGSSSIASPASPTPAAMPGSSVLYGFVAQNMTLTYAAPGPTCDAIGDLVVLPGDTLRIEPGELTNNLLCCQDYRRNIGLLPVGGQQQNAFHGNPQLYGSELL